MWFQKEYMNEAFKIQSSNGSRLVFVGNFHEGHPRGPCWKFYEGGGFLHACPKEICKNDLLSGGIILTVIWTVL